MTTVLIIDDSPDMGHLFKEMVQLLGYNALVSRDGEEGLHVARLEKPDVVLLDVMMPTKNGWQVYEELRLFSTVPVIFLTADFSASNRLRANDIGAVMIRKDVKPIELRQQIENVLHILPD